ncbi:hypothetical protein PM082_015612 [Marasmius tenuissimus]|nr:hypothetical protein PM082_015612 [Marasmius tenuissimus]
MFISSGQSYFEFPVPEDSPVDMVRHVVARIKVLEASQPPKSSSLVDNEFLVTPFLIRPGLARRMWPFEFRRVDEDHSSPCYLFSNAHHGPILVFNAITIRSPPKSQNICLKIRQIKPIRYNARELLKTRQAGSGVDLGSFFLEVYELKGEEMSDESRRASCSKYGLHPAGDPALLHHIGTCHIKRRSSRGTPREAFETFNLRGPPRKCDYNFKSSLSWFSLRYLIPSNIIAAGAPMNLLYLTLPVRCSSIDRLGPRITDNERFFDKICTARCGDISTRTKAVRVVSGFVGLIRVEVGRWQRRKSGNPLRGVKGIRFPYEI